MKFLVLVPEHFQRPGGRAETAPEGLYLCGEVLAVNGIVSTGPGVSAYYHGHYAPDGAVSDCLGAPLS